MKKAQMEILGLAFFFVILIFGFLFFVSLSSETSTKNTLDEYIEPKIASAFTDMLLHTTVRCENGDRSFRELFINCMSYPIGARDICKIDSNIFSNPETYDPEYANPDVEMDSCEIISNFISLGANITLERWAKPYYVEAYILTNNNVDETAEGDLKLNNAFIDKTGLTFNYSIPDLGIPVCYFDQTGGIRSYRSRWQPLPLLTQGSVVLMTGLCH
jgi:hypothetical protein